jgi:catechol 2,3-dioxygenase-like lactoylglutathione lyase family enzyme
VDVDENRVRTQVRDAVPGLRRAACLADDVNERVAWPSSPVPEEHQLHGLDSVTVTVDDPRPTAAVLERVLGMQRLGGDPRSGNRAAAVYGIDGGGPGREIHVLAAPDAPRARLGAGGTHHVGFRAPSLDDVDRYAALVAERRLPSSGAIDRTFFHNLYFREPGGALFEIAADVPARSPNASDAEWAPSSCCPITSSRAASRSSAHCTPTRNSLPTRRTVASETHGGPQPFADATGSRSTVSWSPTRRIDTRKGPVNLWQQGVTYAKRAPRRQS